METIEMISFLKHLVDDYYSQGDHFQFTTQDADSIYAAALRMETMLEDSKEIKIVKE